MRHTLSIIVADQPGELSRIVGLFSARGFNIETLSVGESLDRRWSRVTIVTSGDDRTIQQIVKQCAPWLSWKVGAAVALAAVGLAVFVGLPSVSFLAGATPLLLLALCLVPCLLPLALLRRKGRDRG